jgi:hypothetical protein
MLPGASLFSSNGIQEIQKHMGVSCEIPVSILNNQKYLSAFYSNTPPDDRMHLTSSPVACLTGFHGETAGRQAR